MKKLISLMKNFTFTSIIFTCSVFSQAITAKEITVEQGYIRATIPGTNVSSAYMEIHNLSKSNATLIGASSKVSDRVEIHEHIMSDDMMRMQQRESLQIPANEHVLLQPSGYHLMIFNLSEPLKEDDNIELVLHFSKKEDVVITLPVQSIKRKKQKKPAHHHHH